MDKLLSQACPRGPRSIRTTDGGSLLALSLHCLMRKHGFTGGLADDWNTRFTDEWVFEFTRRGCANTFVLHCSLQAASGKMFVHAREAGGSANAHCLGLLLSKYIPEPGPLASSSWQGLPAEAEALEEMFATHIARPLIAAAVPGPDVREGWGLAALVEALQRREVYISLMLVALAAVVAIARQHAAAAPPK